MSDSPAVILYSDLGNPVGVLFDGYVYRVQVESRDQPTSNATRTSVPASTVDVMLLPVNPNRLNAFIYNFSNSSVYIGLGSTPVTNTDFTFQLASQDSWKVPSNFIGEVHALWSSMTPSGAAFMTEMTP